MFELLVEDVFTPKGRSPIIIAKIIRKDREISLGDNLYDDDGNEYRVKGFEFLELSREKYPLSDDLPICLSIDLIGKSKEYFIGKKLINSKQ